MEMSKPKIYNRKPESIEVMEVSLANLAGLMEWLPDDTDYEVSGGKVTVSLPPHVIGSYRTRIYEGSFIANKGNGVFKEMMPYEISDYYEEES